MPFSEDDLRKALGRKEPSAEFTAKVMARVGQPATEAARSRTPSVLPMRRLMVVRWVAAAGLAASLIAAVGLQQYQHRQEQARAERAQRQALLALQITTEKLDHVFHKTSRISAPNPGRDNGENNKERL
jgi:hypothetical protein